uniref:Uncharacterized protein n=1 Tax=Dunaliella viridis TaxID=140095 RepID=D2SPD8_9CHLO|nr:hypothetical protein [Dunaliella viridis]
MISLNSRASAAFPAKRSARAVVCASRTVPATTGQVPDPPIHVHGRHMAVDDELRDYVKGR